MTVKINAILPKKKFNPESANGEIRTYFLNFADEIKQEMSEYPPDQAWRSRTPKTGPRAGGGRTGAYGRGWENATVRISAASVTVTNSVSYAVVVGGPTDRSPGQSHRLADRGWKSISDVGPEVASHHHPNFSLKIWS